MGLLDRWNKKTTPPVQKQAEPKTKIVKPVAAEPMVGVGAAGSVIGPAGKNQLLAFRLLTKPHVSEKVGSLAERGTYVFEVVSSAEKIAIKKAVETLYHVHVTRVRTARYQGKPVYRGRHPGKRKDWKKAFVTLKQGESLQLYEGV